MFEDRNKNNNRVKKCHHIFFLLAARGDRHTKIFLSNQYFSLIAGGQPHCLAIGKEGPGLNAGVEVLDGGGVGCQPPLLLPDSAGLCWTSPF